MIHPNQPTPTTPRLLLRPQEAADAMGVSLRTIMLWVKGNEIPVVRLGERNLRFSVADLQRWIASRSSWPAGVSLGPEQVGEQHGNNGHE